MFSVDKKKIKNKIVFTNLIIDKLYSPFDLLFVICFTYSYADNVIDIAVLL